MTKKIINKDLKDTNESNKKRYFACANTYAGFINYFSDIVDSHNIEKIYTIKTRDKSYSLILGEIARNAEKKKYSVEYFFCPNDLNCLNGIVINELKTAVTVYSDSKHPVLIENIINLCDFYDETKLINHKKEILDLIAKKNEYNNLAYKFLKAANELAENTSEMSEKYINYDKLYSSVERLISKNIHAGEKHLHEKNNNSRTDEYKFINSVSLSGFPELSTFENEAKKIFYISNENFLGWHYTKIISEKFANTCKVICPDALNPDKIKAVYLRNSKILFVIKNKIPDKIYSEKYNFINMERFISPSFKKENKQKLRFIQKCYKAITNEAVKYFSEAENINTTAGDIYASSVKTSEKNKYTEAVIKKILP